MVISAAVATGARSPYPHTRRQVRCRPPGHRDPRGEAGPGDWSLELGGDGLDLGVGLQHLVAHLAAPAGLLVPAERKRCVEHVVAVDPYRAGPDLFGQGVRLGDVLGPDARAEA